MAALKACPFDGSRQITINPIADKFRAHCEKCGAEGPEADSWAEAEAAWNRRVQGDGDGKRDGDRQ